MTKSANNSADNSNAKANNLETISADEMKLRRSLEQTIRTANKAWYRIGTACAKIRDARLYRSTHATGDAYFAETFDFTRQYVGYLISAARLLDELKAYGFTGQQLPQTESQCRPFRKVPEDMQYDSNIVAIWQSVVDSGQKVTAALITKTVDDIIGPYVIENYPSDSALHKQWAKKAGASAAGSASGNQASGAAGASSAADNTDDQQSEIDELRQLLRQAKAKMAHLESALAAEKKAHQRTIQAKGNQAPQSKLAKDLYRAGFKVMAKQHHPDLGGDAQTMQELNQIKEQLGL